MKKAYLIDFGIMTRVVVDENATEDEIIEAAVQRLRNDSELFTEKLYNGVTNLEEDEEVPYKEDPDDE